MEPPEMKGGMSASTSGRPHSSPMPVGPSILCPLQATRSAPSDQTSMGMCGTDWQASTTNSAPT